ncbi:TRAP transporter small permease [Pelagibius litoralis]|uniref:TRAP transporter small permease protein n=1 Tax=Pelagibius litoralis TaxID=374515 RepID=A0A967C3M4_9PROT|nr:TRAP transporter small permease [Pelagibius litoralis]NIA67665.1 TRAP transporter small permease [Pelagibius litoralis]
MRSDSMATAGTLGLAPALEARIGRALGWASRILALAGGVVLTAVALMTVLSIIGRGFSFAGLGPVPGDFELVEAGCAVAVFAFLPWCQYRRGHVTVDIFISRFPLRLQAGLAVIGNAALSLAACLIAWRLWYGMIDKFSYGETTMILGMKLGYAYAAAVPGAAFFAVVCLYTVWRSVNETIRGQEER